MLAHRGAFLFRKQPFNGQTDDRALRQVQSVRQRFQLAVLLGAYLDGGHDAVRWQGITSCFLKYHKGNTLVNPHPQNPQGFQLAYPDTI